MSLRLRLALVVVGLVAVGLVVSDVATYTSLRSFLVSRIDQQLPSAVGSVAFALRSGEQGSSSGLPPAARAIGGPTMLPPGTYGERRDGGGAVVDWVQFAYGVSSIARPDLPKVLPTGGTGPAPEQAFTVGAVGGSSLLFRALALKEREGPGTLVVAVPLSEVFQTLHRLVLVEVVLSLAVLLGLAALSWWLVSQGLRPLQHFGETAAAIARGDLARRVESVDARTEVGRLGIALNSMLAQIERAFAERLASEERLRRFLADASHELRTPLTSIRGYAELFRRGARQRPEDLETSMRRIEEEAARMGVLVEEMLLLARLDQSRALEAAPVDLAAIAVDAAQDARAAAPDRSIEVETSRPGHGGGRRGASTPGGLQPVDQRPGPHSPREPGRGRGPDGRRPRGAVRGRPGSGALRRRGRAHLRTLLSRRSGARPRSRRERAGSLHRGRHRLRSRGLRGGQPRVRTAAPCSRWSCRCPRPLWSRSPRRPPSSARACLAPDKQSTPRKDPPPRGRRLPSDAASPRSGLRLSGISQATLSPQPAALLTLDARKPASGHRRSGCPSPTVSGGARHERLDLPAPAHSDRSADPRRGRRRRSSATGVWW